MRPQMTPVKSSNLRAVGYSDETGTLWVDFNNGRTYQYPRVSKEHYLNLLSAQSAGSYFHTHLRHLPCNEL